MNGDRPDILYSPDELRVLRSYAYQWNRFVGWARASDRSPLPAEPADIVDYIAGRSAEGVRPSTLKVAAAAIGRRHEELGHDNPCRDGPVADEVSRLMRQEHPAPSRSLPLDLEGYRAIRHTVYEPRSSRGGVPELPDTARRRGSVDVAMIGLMRDAMLRVNEAAEITWGDIENAGGGSGRARVRRSGTDEYRVLSSDTMRLLDSIRPRFADDRRRVLGLRPNAIRVRIAAAATAAGLGDGYGGESPRLGMQHDLHTLGAQLLAERLTDDPDA